ncbi:MAG: hypothetical protein ACRDTG_20100 [Pseudonocardiaceae bacterium]
MPGPPRRPAVTPHRRAFYGIAEIADALNLSRQLVTVWRRRRSHGIPEPDAELSSGPIWRGETVEPWIEVVRSRRDQSASAQPLDPELALRACRRMLRLAALLLERPLRVRLLAQALGELRELLPGVTASADDELGRAVRALVQPLDGVTDAGEAELPDGLRDRVLAALPRVSEVVRVSGKFFSGSGHAD